VSRSSWRLALALLGVVSVGLLGLAPWVLLPNPVDRRMTGAGAKASRAVSANNEPIYPIPQHVELDARKVALGHRLFHDPRLSGDGTTSCASCHDLGRGGTDQRPRSVGIGGRLGTVNAPTVFNSSFNFKQFWDGRAETLEAQIDGPIHDPREMRSNWPEITGKLKEDPGYVAAFASLYGGGIRPNHVKDAIATFERSLITPNSRFDKFLRGDHAAITEEEKEGYLLFKSLGCVACHQGVSVGGNMFQTFGVMADYFADRGGLTSADLGRFNVTGQEQDRYRFKVPSLRNVERTAPYFHDGSAATLEQAVTVMARYQLGRALSAADVGRIVQFLRTLTGEYGGRSL
jgi:cytochrome c peroxidase